MQAFPSSDLSRTNQMKWVIFGLDGFWKSNIYFGRSNTNDIILTSLPEEGLMTNSFVELLITTFLASIAATVMGLFVSSRFSNPDRAMTVAPILLMPQILFSGLIFKLDGHTEWISWLAVCRWSMEGYETTANPNQLQLNLQQEGIMIPHEAENFFRFTNSHIIEAWSILFLFVIILLILASIVLPTIGTEKS